MQYSLQSVWASTYLEQKNGDEPRHNMSNQNEQKSNSAIDLTAHREQCNVHTNHRAWPLKILTLRQRNLLYERGNE